MDKQKLLSIILGLALVTICFLPILKSGLYSDDLFNFQHKTVYNTMQHLNVYELAIPDINYWKALGRYTPISFFLMEFVYKYFITVESYKFFVFTMNILTVIVFLIYLSSLKFKINYGIWMSCFAAVIQFRISYHDAYTSLNGLYQLLTIFIFTGLSAYSFYILKGKLWLLILSILFFIAGILTSEIGLVTIFLLPVSAIILKVPVKKFIGDFLIFILAAGIYLGYVFWLRMHVDAQDAYVGLTTNFDFVSIRNLFYKQLFASLPLSNLHDKYAITIILFHQLKSIKNLISVIAILVATVFILRNLQNQKSTDTILFNWGIILFSIVLIVCPAFFILPSIKYQLEVKWGIGYLPVYIQNFGTATLFAYIIQLFFNSRNNILKWFSNVLFVAIVSTSCVVFLFNNALINSRSYSFAFPAQVFFESVKNGILNDCKNGSTIILGNDFYWKSPGAYALVFKNITGKDFNVYDAETSIPANDSTDCFLFDCQPGKKVFVKLNKINCTDKKIISLIKETKTDCNIELIEEEKTLANY